MDKKTKEKYIKAGTILEKAFINAKKLLQPGAELFECAEKIEETITKEGGEPAFPVNLSLNENAAHQTPGWNDKSVLSEEDVVKVDAGAHIDGFIADAAITINHSEKHSALITAAENALENAFKILEKNPSFSEIGMEIEKAISSKGFKPIENLSGHGLEEFVQHAPPNIPNISNNISKKLESGNAFAIEPFASNGDGYVRESAVYTIYVVDEPKPVRNAHARKIMAFIEENYKTLPFAERWLYRELKMTEFEMKFGLRQLIQTKCIKSYPILHDVAGSIVSQAENSFIKEENQIIPLVNRNAFMANGK